MIYFSMHWINLWDKITMPENEFQLRVERIKCATGHLEKGMCVTLRSIIKDKEIGPVMTGITILVAGESAEVLTE